MVVSDSSLLYLWSALIDIGILDTDKSNIVIIKYENTLF